MDTIAHPLREARLRMGLSLSQLAEHVGSSKSRLSRIENLETIPGPRLALAIAEFTGLAKYKLRPDLWPPPQTREKARAVA